MKFLSPESLHSDPRRTITQLYTGKIEQVNEYEMSKGSVLGNHFHKETVETFYITKGSVKVKIDDKEFIAKKGMMFSIYPFENHTVETLSDTASMMTFLSKAYTEKEPDTWKRGS